MARVSLGRCVAALFVLFVTATVGKADMIRWSYQSGAGPSNLILSTGADVPTSNIILGGSGRTSEHDSINVPVVRLLTNGAHLNFNNASSTLSLTIFDGASHGQHLFLFPVVFNGTADVPSHTAAVALTFPGGATQSVVVGGIQYTVTIGPVQPLTWTTLGAHFPGVGAFLGEIDAQVRVSRDGAAASPEPSSLILAAMGLLTAAAAAWRARRGVRIDPVRA